MTNPSHSDPFSFLCEAQPARAIRSLGEAYKPPERFERGEWTLVAEIPKAPADGDGQDVKVYESRLPSRFFKVVALSTPNSVGEPQKPFALSTGSGDAMGELTGEIAKAIAIGMLGLAENEPSDSPETSDAQ